MPYRAYYLDTLGTLRRDLSEEEIRAAFASKEGLLWVDIVETTDEDAEFLSRVFSFHHLAVEDCLSTKIHPAKIDDFGDYLFIVVHGINHAAESDVVETAELALFLGPHYVISNHNAPLYSVEGVRRQVEDDGRPMRRGPDFLAHALIDALIDNVLPAVDLMSEVAGEIEEEVVRRPSQSTLESILKLKRSVLRVHRTISPQREIMNRLSRGEFPLVREEARIFYRDIYDHLMRIGDLNQNTRDSSDNALSTYLSSVANRQNETMKVLSIVATIFLPLTLLAGIYGMNFEYMPELGWKWGYFAVVGFIAAAIIGALWLFWAKQWLSWGRRRVSRIRLFAVEPEKLVGYIEQLAKLPPRRRK